MNDQDPDHTANCLRLVAALTLESLKTLPLLKQIMACDGLHQALKQQLPVEARAAEEVAASLRRADACQLTFREILTAA